MGKSYRSRFSVVLAWSVHVFTALGAVIAILTFDAIIRGHYNSAFWWMFTGVAIDSVDGSLARRFRVKEFASALDGSLLDNIVDYLNYVVTPAIMLMVHPDLLPNMWHLVVPSCIVLSSAYQFSHVHAKTSDNFFLGFPSYWNIAVFYLVAFRTPPVPNVAILLFLVATIFMPVKYLYLSRMTHVSKSAWMHGVIWLISLGYLLAVLAILLEISAFADISKAYLLIYVAFYVALSLYRTWVPIR